MKMMVKVIVGLKLGIKNTFSRILRIRGPKKAKKRNLLKRLKKKWIIKAFQS
jgi:hypothetical protein